MDESDFEPVGPAASVVVGLLSSVLTIGLIAIGLFSVYVRELEPQSDAESGCQWDATDYAECVGERADHEFLTPGIWWFIAAGLVVVSSIALIFWLRGETLATRRTSPLRRTPALGQKTQIRNQADAEG